MIPYSILGFIKKFLFKLVFHIFVETLFCVIGFRNYTGFELFFPKNRRYRQVNSIQFRKSEI